MSIDWSLWGPPLVAAGLPLMGLLYFWRTLSTNEGSDLSTIGRQNDLEAVKEEVLRSLRALEYRKDLLDPAVYAQEREALLARGGDALRGLDASEIAVEAPPPAPTPKRRGLNIGPEWKGAIYALAAVGFVWFFYNLASTQSTARIGDAPMTGGQSAGENPSPAPLNNAEATALDAALAANPTDVSALNGLTQIALVEGNLSVAMSYNQRSLDADPANVDGRMFRGVLAAMVGMYDRAIVELEDILTDAPAHPQARTYLGLVFLEAGKPDQAIPLLEAALALQPNNVALAEALARANNPSMIPTPPAPPPQPMGSGATLVRGHIELPEAQATQLTGQEVVFVSLKSPEGGPPIAAKKLPLQPFPMDFHLQQSDVIAMGGAPRPVPERFHLTVRIDGDGDPMTKAPGEFAAEVQDVTVGSEGLSVPLR